MVKIRLLRMGRKKIPFFRIVVMNSKRKRDGIYLEKLGHYDPLWKNKKNVKVAIINKERFLYWKSVGAQPTKTVLRLFKNL